MCIHLCIKYEVSVFNRSKNLDGDPKKYRKSLELAYLSTADLMPAAAASFPLASNCGSDSILLHSIAHGVLNFVLYQKFWSFLSFVIT